MNGFDRVSTLFKGKAPDRTPRGEIFISLNVAKKLSSRARPVEAYLEALSELRVDLVTVDPSIWSTSDFHTIVGWAKTNGLFVFLVDMGPLTWLTLRLGFEKTMVLSAGGAGGALLRDLVNYQTKRWQGFIRLGVDGLIIADDMAGQDGPWLSPVHWKRLASPCLKRLIDAIGNNSGVPFIFHSDGRYPGILPSLVNVGFNGVHGLDISEASLRELTARFSNLVFWGGIKFENAVGFKAAAQIRQEVKALTGQPRNNLILGSGSGLYDGLPSELIGIAYSIGSRETALGAIEVPANA